MMFPLSMSMSMTDDRASPDNSTSVNVTTAETIPPTNTSSVNDTLDILPSDVDTDDVVDLSEESVQVAGEDTPPSGSPATTAVVAITGVGGMVITLLIFRHT